MLLQNLKADITKAIRLNQQLEKDVDMMDIKIGLLVKNRLDSSKVGRTFLISNDLLLC